MHWTMPFRAPVGLLAAAALGIGLFFLSAGAGQDTPPTAIPVRVIIVGSAAEAGKILEQLKSGADFAVLAREKSVDATSVDGGFMGNVNPATLRADLQPKEIPDLDEAEQARQFAISALATVRYSFDISGLNETQAALSSFPKPDDWYQDLRGACEMREGSRAAAKDRAERYLSPDKFRENSIRKGGSDVYSSHPGRQKGNPGVYRFVEPVLLLLVRCHALQ